MPDDSSHAPAALEDVLAERGVGAVMYSGWEAIDALERSGGEPGRPRIKLATWDELLAAGAPVGEPGCPGCTGPMR